MSNLIDKANQIISASINAVKPENLIRRKVQLIENDLQIGDRKYNLNLYEKIYVVGEGKASALMAKEIEEILGTHLSEGLVIVKYGHGCYCRKIKIFEAGHPVIDGNCLTATKKMLEIANKAQEKDLVICLISGGGSALLEQLPTEITLHDLRKVFELLLSCGADIEEINAVRKHLSNIKGGQLTRAISPATCVSLILSDVIGDPLESIASGPTAPDITTFADAWNVVQKYRLEEQLPKPVKRYLRDGLAGKNKETLKPTDPVFKRVFNIVIGNNFEALSAARKRAKELGFSTLIISSRIQGEAREVAKVVAAIVREIQEKDLPIIKPACILMGGETTVTIRGKGKGGRNQELALAALLAMKNVEQPYIIVSCGTDGTDGPTDAAGGVVFPEMWKEVRSAELNPLRFLTNNDSYSFLKETGGLIKTGPTGTNVMDIIFALVP